MKPYFILGAGGHKCASTWISELLRRHPSVEMSNPKEIHFFSRHLAKGVAWYLSHFKDPDKTHAEFSSDYIYISGCAHDIKSHLSDHYCVKVVVSVRDPVDRAVSHVRHLYRSMNTGKPITKVDLLKVVEQEPNILNYSLYSKGIKEFVEVFGKENVFVLDYADLESNPFLFSTRLLEHLELPDHDFGSFLNKVESPAFSARSSALENFRNSVFWYVYNNAPIFISLYKNIGMSKVYRFLNAAEPQPIEKDALQWLSERLATDWVSTQQYLNRSL